MFRNFQKKTPKWRPLFYIEFIFDLRECWSQRAPEWMANEELEKAFQKVYIPLIFEECSTNLVVLKPLSISSY